MKKTFKMQDLDCAHCAAKMEAAIQKLDGVKSATILDGRVAHSILIELLSDAGIGTMLTN